MTVLVFILSFFQILWHIRRKQTEAEALKYKWRLFLSSRSNGNIWRVCVALWGGVFSLGSGAKLVLCNGYLSSWCEVTRKFTGCSGSNSVYEHGICEHFKAASAGRRRNIFKKTLLQSCFLAKELPHDRKPNWKLTLNAAKNKVSAG